MRKSLRGKLIFIMLILIVLLMTVVLVFLIRGVQDFFLSDFYGRMSTAFSNTDMVTALREAADEDDAPRRMSEILEAFTGLLGVEGGARNFYILDGVTGERLAGAEPPDGAPLGVTPNILTALAGDAAYTGSPGTDYMDIAVPISGRAGRFIVYIRDDRSISQTLSSELFKMILEAVAVGFAMSAAISLLLSHTILLPIRGMTTAAAAMAGGDFSREIPVESEDEIGTLARTFNTMAAQLHETLDELQKAEKLRRDFVANVSHELRTPVTSIRAYAETIQDTPDLDEATRAELLRVILNESDRMTKLVQDLLVLSSLDAGSTRMSPERFSLEKSVRDVYAAIAIQAERRDQRMDLELEYGMPEIFGDRARIEQVLMNIMTNAVKYTPEGGEISIFSGARDGHAWVQISDTGIGIPEDDIPHVFDRFYRVDKARSRESGGTGLGLSIAQEIILRHRGRIEVTSRQGVGTTFTVALPIDSLAVPAAVSDASNILETPE
ncbi:MAG: cell wall metabolism sensor histidine kinase WalK [Oscillospiraceae bacterium]|jgi:signal transduction histidine kinase|nr:cell wall metabolism sensor histidine kinase WalK [Oscillospiraceae bacterium]